MHSISLNKTTSILRFIALIFTHYIQHPYRTVIRMMSTDIKKKKQKREIKRNALDDRRKSDREGMQQQRDQKNYQGIETEKNNDDEKEKQEQNLTEPNSI